MKEQQPAQTSMQLAVPETGATNVEKYEFQPIKGYPAKPRRCGICGR